MGGGQWVTVPLSTNASRRATASSPASSVTKWPASGSSTTCAWAMARELLASNDWYDELWGRRRALADKPVLVMWGMRDWLMPPRHLARWREALPHAQVVELPDAGHFVTEEAGEEAVARLHAFVDNGTVTH